MQRNFKLYEFIILENKSSPLKIANKNNSDDRTYGGFISFHVVSLRHCSSIGDVR